MTGAEPLPTDPSTTHPAPETPSSLVDEATVTAALSAITSTEPTEEASLYYDAATMAPLNALSLVGPPSNNIPRNG